MGTATPRVWHGVPRPVCAGYRAARWNRYARPCRFRTPPFDVCTNRRSAGDHEQEGRDASDGVREGQRGERAGRDAQQRVALGDDGLQRGAGEGGRDAGRRRAASQLARRPGGVLGPGTARDRRPVRRDEGAGRGLLAVAGALARRGGRVDQAQPVPGRRGRAAPDLRARRLRCGAHARTARAGRADARRDAVGVAVTAGGDVHRTVEAVWRIESARLIAGIARRVNDLELAEDLAQEALVAAMEQWPESGVPDNPGAWLAATARNRAVDRIRRDQTLRRKTDELGHMVERGGGFGQPPPGERLDEPVDDDLLRLVFTTCHPVLSTDARVALTLRLLGGLTTAEIASAFLVPEPTVAQRIVRAKRTLAAARVPFEAPSREQLPERLGDVLEVVYLIFNEGYAASSGDRVVRSELLEEALRMGRILAGLMPAEPEVHGLLALMELSASRVRARV